MKKVQEVNYQMVTLARESRGYKQKELSDLLNIPQGRLSKIENGLLGVDESLLSNLSNVLDYPKEFFMQDERIYPPGYLFFRKHKTIPKKTQDFIFAQLVVRRFVIQKIIRNVEIEVNVPNLSIEEYGTPEEVARVLRYYWMVPEGRIENVTNLLEDKGIPIIPCDFSTRKFSGVSTHTEDGYPIIFLNPNMPGDRQRYTLIHELGHIVMHKIPSLNMEEEANKFTSEFLMPERLIKNDLSCLTLEKVAMLKPKWKVSMGSIIERAYELKKITLRQRTYLWTQMSKYGYRLEEPQSIAVPKEKPSLLEEIFKTHTNELGYSIKEMLQFIFHNEHEFTHLYGSFIDSDKLKKIRIV